MMRRAPFVALSMVLWLMSAIASGQIPLIDVHGPDQDASWERLKEEDGITVFLRDRAGSPAKEGLGQGVINAPPCRVYQVLTDSERFTQLIPYVKARIVKKTDSGWDHVCQYLDFPWPIGDRLVVFRMYDIPHYQQRSCEYVLHWHKDDTYACSTTDIQQIYAEAVPDPVIPAANEGYWHLQPQQGGRQTLLSYYVYTDPGGSLPAWITNGFVDNAMLRLIRAVRDQAQEDHLYPPCTCTRNEASRVLEVASPVLP